MADKIPFELKILRMNSLYFRLVPKNCAIVFGITRTIAMAAVIYPMLLPPTAHALSFSSFSQLATQGSLQAQQKSEGDPETRVRQMYEEITGNEPSEETVQEYLQAHANGWTFSRIRNAIANSSAAQTAVKTIYQEILERKPEKEVLRSWLEALSQGWTIEEVREEVATTLEAKALIDHIYQDVLNRKADDKGMETWTDALARGWTLEEVREEIASSSEARENEE